MQLNTVKHILSSVFRRNHILLTNTNYRTVKGAVNLHWWKLESPEQNVGDFLSTIVVDYMMKHHNCTDSKAGKTRHLYAIGSIIDGAYQNATIWGSGILRGNPNYWWKSFRKLDVRAVRGPKTREILLQNGYDCPAVYGDPAILLPLIYQPKPVAAPCEFRVVPNHSIPCDHALMLHPMVTDWQGFIDELVSANRIISSSLHGIILAEAYGVPAILVHDKSLSLFKYEDYYSSTGRDVFPVASSVEEALTMTPPPLPDLAQLQQCLIESFPKDLW